MDKYPISRPKRHLNLAIPSLVANKTISLSVLPVSVRKASICSNDIDILCVSVASNCSCAVARVWPCCAAATISGDQRRPHISWLLSGIRGSELRPVWLPQTSARLSTVSCWGSERRNCLQLTAERRGPWDMGFGDLTS